MRGRNECISNSNVSIKTMSILCAGCCFLGLFCDSAVLSVICMHIKGLCSDLQGGLGGGEQKPTKRRQKRGYVCLSLCAVIQQLLKIQQLRLNLSSIP